MEVKIKKNFFRLLLEYLLAFLIILECRSVFSVSTDANYYFTYVSIAVLSFTIISKLIVLKQSILKQSIITIFIIFIYINIFIFFNKGALSGIFLAKYIILFPMFIIYFGIERKKLKDINLLKCIVNIMVILSGISLFFWFFGSVLGIIQTTCTINYIWGGEKVARGYYFLSYITQHYNLSEIGLPSFDIIRNTGIFTEAPMYNINLCIALLLEMFLFNEPNNWKVKVLVITIISTFSTMGIFILISLICIKWVLNNSNSRLIKILRWIIFPIVIIVTMMVIIYFFNSKSTSISWRGHSGDFVAGFFAWKDSPIIGHGYGNYDELLKYYSGDLLSLRIINKGFSNSIMYLLAQCGLWMFLVYYVPFAISIYREAIRRNFNYVILLLYIIMLYSAVLITYQNIMIMILSILITNLYIRDSNL